MLIVERHTKKGGAVGSVTLPRRGHHERSHITVMEVEVDRGGAIHEKRCVQCRRD